MRKGNLRSKNAKLGANTNKKNAKAEKKRIDIVTENDNLEDELDQMNENLINKMEMMKLSEKELDAL